jgi:hypothetical protein
MIANDSCTDFTQIAYAKAQVEWAKKSKQQWEEARAEVEKIEER